MKQPEYVGFTPRLFATAIDSILSIFLLIPAYSVFVKIYTPSNQQILNQLDAGSSPNDAQLHQLLIDSLISMGFQNFVFAVFVIVFWMYKSATPGKIILNMKVIDIKTGEKPSKTQFMIRYLGYFVSTFGFLLGFFWVAWDKKCQGWHDKMANTAVIYNK